MVAMIEALDALAAAGVKLSRGVVDQRDSGDPDGALMDAIALADEQQVVLSADVVRRVRSAFEQLGFNPRTNLGTLVGAALKRIEQRSAGSAA